MRHSRPLSYLTMAGIIKRIILITVFFIISNAAIASSEDADERARHHYQIGNFYYQLGRYKDAKKEFQRALDLLSQETTYRQKIEPKSESPKKTTTDYIIDVADVLKISVWQNADLDSEVIVRPDGKISFPLVGDIQVAGLTVTELDSELTERLKEFLKYPEVSISIKQFGGSKVIVLGQVEHPGIYSVTGTKSILEAIGLAGGFTDDAVSSSVILIRDGFQAPQAQRINLTKAISRSDLRENVVLQSEDIVFVPKKFIANLNYFLNQILEPLSRGTIASEEINSW